MYLVDVTVIIVNYNTKVLLRNCINSLITYTLGLNYEIIVVDNNSIDGSKDMIKNEFDEIIIIDSNINLGFGKANNRAFSIAKGKYFFLLNSDTVLKNNAVKCFYDFYESYGIKYNVGALGGLLYDEKGNLVYSYSTFPSMKEILLGNLKSSLKIKNKNFNHTVKEQTQVDYITGADLFIPKEIICEIGGFDERFFMYFEETELQFRISKLKKKRIIINTPQIIHLQGKSIKIINRRRIIYERSMFLYFRITNKIYKVYVFKIVYFIFRFLSMFKRKYTIKENMEYIKNYIRF